MVRGGVVVETGRALRTVGRYLHNKLLVPVVQCSESVYQAILQAARLESVHSMVKGQPGSCGLTVDSNPVAGVHIVCCGQYTRALACGQEDRDLLVRAVLASVAHKSIMTARTLPLLQANHACDINVAIT